MEDPKAQVVWLRPGLGSWTYAANRTSGGKSSPPVPGVRVGNSKLAMRRKLPAGVLESTTSRARNDCLDRVQIALVRVVEMLHNIGDGCLECVAVTEIVRGYLRPL